MDNFKKYYLIIIMILVLSINCTRNRTPVGPYVGVQPGDEAFNLNNYTAVRTNYYCHFNGVNELHGFKGVWISPGSGMESSCQNTTGSNLEMSYTNIQPKDNDYSNPYGYYGYRVEKIWALKTNLYDIQNDDEILVIQFKAKCLDEGRFKPIRISIEFLETTAPSSDKTGSQFFTTKPIPSSWTNMSIPFSYFTKSKEAQALSLIEAMKKVIRLDIGTYSKAVTAGQSVWIYLDDFRIVVYKRNIN